jgi:hypothetical protein
MKGNQLPDASLNGEGNRVRDSTVSLARMRQVFSRSELSIVN